MITFRDNLEQQAVIGNQDAQFQLGLIYCIQGEQYRAKQWLQQAAQAGHRKAMAILVKMNDQILLDSAA